MRKSFSSRGLVAFIADGSILPRIRWSGSEALDSSVAVAFRSHPSLCIKMETPNGGIVSGMGIPESVNISTFINNFSTAKDTVCFCSEEASGSTFQAANIMEAVEVGADLLLLDEDASAPNFMIRDTRMQRLVAKKRVHNSLG